MSRAPSWFPGRLAEASRSSFELLLHLPPQHQQWTIFLPPFSRFTFNRFLLFFRTPAPPPPQPTSFTFSRVGEVARPGSWETRPQKLPPDRCGKSVLILLVGEKQSGKAGAGGGLERVEARLELIKIPPLKQWGGGQDGSEASSESVSSERAVPSWCQEDGFSTSSLPTPPGVVKPLGLSG